MKSYLRNIISFWSNRNRYLPHQQQYFQIIIHIALTIIDILVIIIHIALALVNITVIIINIGLSATNSFAKNSNYGHHRSAIMFSNLIFG